MPVSTLMVRFSKSTFRMRFMRERPMTMASSAGSAPPDSEVPAPRGTTFRLFWWQYLRSFDTSSVERGSATTSGMQR